MNQASLWAWFLFESGLRPQRAKELLSTWQARSWSLRDALDRLTVSRGAPDLTAAEAKQLSPPGLLPVVEGLTWNDPLYPGGLAELPLKLKPALLFCKGEPSQLSQPIVYLAPSPVEPDDQERLREAITLLMGEPILLSAHRQTDQAQLLLEELTYGDGFAILWAEAGLEALTYSDRESNLLQQGRLLILSPLPPMTPPRPAWTGILHKVAAAAADRVLLSGARALHPDSLAAIGHKPALAISPVGPETAAPTTVQLAAAPTDVLPWIEFDVGADQTLDAPGEPVHVANQETYSLAEDVPGPPPSPEEILKTLSRGGEIPEVLRKRLTDQSS